MSEHKFLGANLNTILMAVVLAVMSWLGAEVRNTALALVELRTSATLTSKANAEALARLEGVLNNSVSRREFGGRVLAIEARLAEVSLKLRELDLALAKLSRQP